MAESGGAVTNKWYSRVSQAIRYVILVVLVFHCKNLQLQIYGVGGNNFCVPRGVTMQCMLVASFCSIFSLPNDKEKKWSGYARLSFCACSRYMMYVSKISSGNTDCKLVYIFTCINYLEVLRVQTTSLLDI